jgi:hypothetical protein
VVYLVIAFGGAWILWAVALPSGVPATSPQFQVLALPGGFAPAVAAIAVRKWVTREGFADAGLRLRLRRGWPYYLFAWLLPLVVVAVIVALAAILGAGRADLTLQRALEELYPGANMSSFLPPGPLALLVVVPTLLVQAVVFAPVLWGEESRTHSWGCSSSPFPRCCCRSSSDGCDYGRGASGAPAWPTRLPTP